MYTRNQGCILILYLILKNISLFILKITVALLCCDDKYMSKYGETREKLIKFTLCGIIILIKIVKAGCEMGNIYEGFDLKRYSGKIIIAVLAIVILALAGCGGNDDYRSLVNDLNQFNINYIDDIEEMIYIAWDYDASVEVEYLDYSGYLLETDFVNNDRSLNIFLDELQYGEVHMLNAEVLEEGNNLYLIFSVEVN